MSSSPFDYADTAAAIEAMASPGDAKRAGEGVPEVSSRPYTVSVPADEVNAVLAGLEYGTAYVRGLGMESAWKALQDIERQLLAMAEERAARMARLQQAGEK